MRPRADVHLRPPLKLFFDPCPPSCWSVGAFGTKSPSKDIPFIHIAMKHRLSEARKAFLSRPFSHTGRFWGAAMVACVVAPFGYWKLAPLEAGNLAVLAVYLALAAGVSALVVTIRRWLRPPKAVLENTFIDVTPGGISRETPTSRTWFLASPQVGRASLYWHGSELVRVVLHAENRDVEVHGLEDMAGFVDDLRRTFVRLNCTDVRAR